MSNKNEKDPKEMGQLNLLERFSVVSLKLVRGGKDSYYSSKFIKSPGDHN
jgi:hypothetical protein